MSNKHLFLQDDNTYLEVDVNIPKGELELLRKKYIEKQNTAFFSYLFEKNSIPYKHNRYRFFAFSDNLSSSQNNSIIEFVKTIIANIDVLFLKGQVVIFYPDLEQFSFKNVLDTLNDDFSISLKGYESFPLDVAYPQDFKIIFNCYLNHLHQKLRSFSNTNDLIFDIVKTNYPNLKPLREIILRKIINDPQLENLINMFFLCNLNISKTAKRVYMHRNTIMNKIEFIKTNTGFDIQEFNDALAVYLLIKAK